MLAEPTTFENEEASNNGRWLSRLPMCYAASTCRTARIMLTEDVNNGNAYLWEYFRNGSSVQRTFTTTDAIAKSTTTVISMALDVSGFTNVMRGSCDQIRSDMTARHLDRKEVRAGTKFMGWTGGHVPQIFDRSDIISFVPLNILWLKVMYLCKFHATLLLETFPQHKTRE